VEVKGSNPFRSTRKTPPETICGVFVYVKFGGLDG
jgi:hypothetical protein